MGPQGLQGPQGEIDDRCPGSKGDSRRYGASDYRDSRLKGIQVCMLYRTQGIQGLRGYRRRGLGKTGIQGLKGDTGDMGLKD